MDGIRNEKDKEKKTPIIDGDARPDIDLHPEDKKKLKDDHKKTTHNRNDTNSLEDFKDAKQE